MKNFIPVLTLSLLIVTGLIFDNFGSFERGYHRFLGESVQSGVVLSEISDGLLNLSANVNKQSLKDLVDILNYPLDEGTGVPRVEISRLPEVYKEIEDTKYRKAMFLRILLPLVLLENEALEKTRNRMNTLLENIEQGKALSLVQLADLKSISKKYNIKGSPLTNPEVRKMLRKRVDIVPPSLALAQAANESGWGNSRFAMEASNLFGIWTYNEKDGVVPDRRDSGKKHLVRKFDSLRDSVRVYMHTLNTHLAYAELREIRSQMKKVGVDLNGIAIAEGLKKYSILGEEYVRLIQEIIATNNLENLNLARLQAV